VTAIDFSRKTVLIGGSSYATEIKKAVFTTLNYFLPAQNVMPMHCSANVGPQDDAATREPGKQLCLPIRGAR
jgi:phosphoenolpyruvate carboxykinase (ATP)